MMNRKYGIRTHIAWLTSLPLLVIVIALEGFFLHERFVDLDRDLITRGQLMARQLAASSEYGVFSNNSSFLNGIAESALLQPDVKAVIVLGANSQPIVTAGKSSAASENGLHPVLGFSGTEAAMSDNRNTVLLYQPIVSSQVSLDDNNLSAVKIGAVVIEMGWDLTKREKSRLLMFTTLVTGAFLLVMLYLVHLASRRIIEPITRLSAAIGEIGKGNLDTRVSQPGCIHELCALASGINQMTAELQHERAELQQERTQLQHRINEATSQLRGLAFYDTLTLLPNRRLLTDRLTQAMASSRRSGRYGALMFIDLDNFKPLNDRFGHAVGDLLLIEAARRISSCLRETDTVARFGGDEFVVMLTELDTGRCESAVLAENVAEKIRAVLADEYCLVSRQPGQPEIRVEHHCTSSIGVMLFLNHELSQDEILYWADAMMYQAKKDGRNRIRFYEAQEGEF